MRTMTKRIISAVILVLLLLGLKAQATVQVLEMPKEVSASSVNWMSNIPGDTKLSSISIPGTHDSASQYISLPYILQCQNTSIAQQLDNGYRYIDLRLAMDEKDGQMALKFTHSIGNCKESGALLSDNLYLDSVLADMYAFLDEHPTETIIAVVKPENEDDSLGDFQSLLYQYISSDMDKWYLENEIPMLDDVRGKIVLATRFDDVNQVGEMKRGLNFKWEDQGSKEVIDIPYVQSMINDNEFLWVQDRYKYNVNRKLDAVKDDLFNCQAGDDTFSINFLSTAGNKAVGHPEGYALQINKEFLNTSLEAETCYGIVVIDYATAELAEHVYETNFAK